MRGGGEGSLGLPGAAGAAEVAAVAGADELAFVEGLRPSRAQPEAALATAKTIPKSQPGNIRVFI